MTSNMKLSCCVALTGALSIATACDLGGDPVAEPDASTGVGGTDADPNDADGGPQLTACEQAMLDAPTGDSAPSFLDSLPTASQNTWDNESVPSGGDEDYPGGKYRTIEPDGAGNIHPGCSAEGVSYPDLLAEIPGYPCAAKEYPFPDGVSEDTDKPIVILVHGNSDSPSGWESFLHPNPEDWMDDEPREQLAELLPAAGFRTVAVDLRIDLVDDPKGDLETENAALNIDHGWSVPITQELIRAIAVNNPDREIAIIGFSLGATVIRDALRRLWVEWHQGEWDTNIFARVRHVIPASGANHGVSLGPICGTNRTMRGTVTCEMGIRNQYSQTTFHEPLNGPRMQDEDEWGGWYETPCADGDYAFGERDACEGNTVTYTTIAIEDNPDGTQEDAFTSEHTSRLYPTECANNVVNPQTAFDTSGYYMDIFPLQNHYGSVRSETGLGVIMSTLQE